MGGGGWVGMEEDFHEFWSYSNAYFITHTVINNRKIVCAIVKQIAVIKMYQNKADLLRDFNFYLHCLSNCCLRTHPNGMASFSPARLHYFECGEIPFSLGPTVDL